MNGSVCTVIVPSVGIGSVYHAVHSISPGREEGVESTKIGVAFIIELLPRAGPGLGTALVQHAPSED